MKYHVKGLDATDGRERESMIEAGSVNEAMDRASELNIMVKTCLEAPPMEAKTLVIPVYTTLQAVGSIVFVLGALAVVGGGISWIVAAGAPHGSQPEMAATGVAAFAWGLGMLALGQGLLALRDMAVNSWHIRRAVEEKP